jgi:hypothetical protein
MNKKVFFLVPSFEKNDRNEPANATKCATRAGPG